MKKSFSLFTIVTIILLVLFSCSTKEDDFGEAVPIETSLNFLPLAINNQWEYHIEKSFHDSVFLDTLEKLIVADSAHTYDTPSFYIKSNLPNDQQGILSNMLHAGFINKVEGRLIFNGQFTLPLPSLQDSVAIPLRNLVLLDQNRSVKDTLYSIKEAVPQDLQIADQNFQALYQYHFISEEDDQLDSYVTDEGKFENVIVNKISVILSIYNIAESGANAEILPKQKVIETLIYFAEDTGIIEILSHVQMEFSNLEELDITENLDYKGAEKQILKGYNLNLN